MSAKTTSPEELQVGKCYDVTTSRGGESRRVRGRFVGVGGWLWPSTAGADAGEILTFVVSEPPPHEHMLIHAADFVEAIELTA